MIGCSTIRSRSKERAACPLPARRGWSLYVFVYENVYWRMVVCYNWMDYHFHLHRAPPSDYGDTIATRRKHYFLTQDTPPPPPPKDVSIPIPTSTHIVDAIPVALYIYKPSCSCGLVPTGHSTVCRRCSANLIYSFVSWFLSDIPGLCTLCLIVVANVYIQRQRKRKVHLPRGFPF